MLQKIDVSQAREKLSHLMESAFFSGEKYVLLRRGIPMAVITGINDFKVDKNKISSPKNKNNSLFGIWKKMKNSTLIISDDLRKKAWESQNYVD